MLKEGTLNFFKLHKFAFLFIAQLFHAQNDSFALSVGRQIALTINFRQIIFVQFGTEFNFFADMSNLALMDIFIFGYLYSVQKHSFNIVIKSVDFL